MQLCQKKSEKGTGPDTIAMFPSSLFFSNSPSLVTVFRKDLSFLFQPMIHGEAGSLKTEKEQLRLVRKGSKVMDSNKNTKQHATGLRQASRPCTQGRCMSGRSPNPLHYLGGDDT